MLPVFGDCLLGDARTRDRGSVCCGAVSVRWRGCGRGYEGVEGKRCVDERRGSRGRGWWLSSCCLCGYMFSTWYVSIVSRCVLCAVWVGLRDSLSLVMEALCVGVVEM